MTFTSADRIDLAPYVPRLVVDWLRHTPDERFRRVDGTVVFADISGFTKLSERLARLGKVGAEELAEAIGRCFAHLLSVAYDEGGSLLKFGGDALFLLFTGEHHEVRGARAAIGMRRALRDVGRLTVAGERAQLRISIGVHRDVFDLFLVGGPYRDLVITGPATTTTVAMEGAANAGDIVVSPALADHFPASAVGPEQGPGRRLVRPPAARRGEGGRAPVPVDAGEVGLDHVLCPLVLDAVRSSEHGPEHRLVTVAFIHFDGTDRIIETDGPASFARMLDETVRVVQAVVDPLGVTFLGTDVDKDGGKIILAAGAPVSTGDDERRMLLALRSIFDADPPLSLRAGVNRGHVFTGDIGPHYRRTFTVMGDVVNLAARIMAHATPGQILAGEAVVANLSDAFDLEPVEPFRAKGKSAPVRAVAVGRARTSRAPRQRGSLPLIGREAEAARLRSLLDVARAGSGSVVEIVGEPGSGKTRLVEELRSQHDDRRRIEVICDPYQSASAYLPLRAILRSLLGVDGAPDRLVLRRLVEALDHAEPALSLWAPLVAPAVGLTMRETAETAAIEPEFRPARTRAVLTTLLASLLTEPTVVVIEDAQWLDDASAEFVDSLAAVIRGAPVLLVLTRREPRELPDVETIRLEPLPPDQARVMLEQLTEDTPLPPHTIDALVARADGNPLFLSELADLALQRGPDAAIPDSVEALTAARLDTLPGPDRAFVRRASVLGRSFRLELLQRVEPATPAASDPAWSRIEDFLRLSDDGVVSFDHALLRDTAYETLPYRQRRDLHGRAADAIRTDGYSDDDAGLLSLHYLEAQRHREAMHYALLAAGRASALYANAEAVTLYERAASAAGRVDGMTDDQLASIHESLGDMHTRVGTYPAALAAYRQSRRLAGGNSLAQARLALKVAQVKGKLERFSTALRWLTKGLQVLDGIESDAAEHQRAQLLSWYAFFCHEEGLDRRALTWCERAIDVATACADTGALAFALKITDFARIVLGELDEPTNLHRALTLYEELDDLPGQASVLNLLGMLAYWRGDWARAQSLYERARDIVARTGNPVLHAYCTSNLGEIMLDQGRLDEAESMFRSARRVWRSAGDRAGVAFVNGNLARVAAQRGDYDAALTLFDVTSTELRALGARIDLLETQARKAECLLERGDAPGALDLAEHTLREMETLDANAAQQPVVHRVRGRALLGMGRAAEAREALEASLESARARQADAEVARTLAVLIELILDDGGSPVEEAAERVAIVRRLGIIEIVDLRTADRPLSVPVD